MEIISAWPPYAQATNKMAKVYKIRYVKQRLVIQIMLLFFSPIIV